MIRNPRLGIGGSKNDTGKGRHLENNVLEVEFAAPILTLLLDFFNTIGVVYAPRNAPGYIFFDKKDKKI